MAPSWGEALLRRMARPRLPGSAAVADAEAAIAEHLKSLGLAVRGHPFSTSPRRLYALSIGAAATGWASLGLVPVLVLPFPAWSAAVTGLAILAAVGVVTAGLAEGRLPLQVPTVTARNLVARRQDDVRIWLVAHSDSKAQRMGLGTRVIAVASFGIGVAGLVLCLFGRLLGPVPAWAWLPSVLATVAGGGVLSAKPVRDGSPGAVDNATGVVAALAAAEALRDRPDVGVLITGAEEYGMEGARAWIASGGAGEAFVNFDGIDNRGLFNVMAHRGGGPPRSAPGDGLPPRVQAALRARGQGVRRMPLPLGIFVDGSVLAAGGIPGATVSRGDWRTLQVVHTERDTPDRMDVSSALEAGRAAADAIRAHFG